jgi:hypothetical protein
LSRGKLSIVFTIYKKAGGKAEHLFLYKMKLLFTLEKKATSNGGDKYVSTYEYETVQIYFPQSLTRKKGEPVKHLTMELGFSKEPSRKRRSVEKKSSSHTRKRKRGNDDFFIKESSSDESYEDEGVADTSDSDESSGGSDYSNVY